MDPTLLQKVFDYLESHTEDPEMVARYREYDDKRKYPAGTIVRRKGRPHVPLVVCHHFAGNGESGLTVTTQLDNSGHHQSPAYFPEHGTWTRNDELELFPIEPDPDEVAAAIASIASVSGQREDAS